MKMMTVLLLLCMFFAGDDDDDDDYLTDGHPDKHIHCWEDLPGWIRYNSMNKEYGDTGTFPLACTCAMGSLSECWIPPASGFLKAQWSDLASKCPFAKYV